MVNGSRLKMLVLRSPDGLSAVRNADTLLDTQEHVQCALRPLAQPGHFRCVPRKGEDGTDIGAACLACQKLFVDAQCTQTAVLALPGSMDILVAGDNVYRKGDALPSPHVQTPAGDCLSCDAASCDMSGQTAYALGEDITPRFVELVEGWE